MSDFEKQVEEDRDELANAEAEVERLRAELETAALDYKNLYGNFQKLEAENAEFTALINRQAEQLRAQNAELGALWQAIDDAMAADPEKRWEALERIESAAYVVRTKTSEGT